MADVSIKIQLQDTIEDVIGGVSSNKATNNVSSIVSKNTQKNDGTPLLSFAPGYIKFDVDGNLVNADGVAGKAILEGTYNGFVFGATNASGEYSVTLTITGSHIDSLIFYGDKLANQFPIEAYLDGDTANKIYSDDYIWAIVFDASTTSHSVTFTKWNRANYNACFTHIAVLRNELWLDKAWIKNVESVSQCTGQPNEIFYGTIANSGSAEILDRNGELLDYITEGIIENSNLPVSIWANGKQVQAHITNNSDYDTNSITLSFEMTNDFENWNNINYDGYLFSTTSINAYNMLVSVLNSIGYQNDYSNNYTGQLIDEMLDTYILIGNSTDSNVSEMSVKSYLQSITIPYPCLKSDTFKNIIEKFCILAQLQVYKDDNNKIKFISARPCVTTNELTKAIIIPAKHESSVFAETKILKNKYNGVEINKKIITKEENSNIYSSNTIYCCEDRVFIGNNEGVNEEIYDVYGGTFDTTNWFQFNFSIDLEKLNKERNLPINLDELKIEIVLNRKNYKMRNFNYTQDVEADTSNNILLKYSSTELNYHAFDTAFIDGQSVFNNIYSAKIDNNILYIRCQIEWATDIGSAVFEDVSYNMAFVQDFTFNILKPTYSIEDNTLKTGDKTVKINDCILIQENALFNDTYDISSLISNNIKYDYGLGIADATVTIICSNYYDINGNLVKDWSKGEIIQVGDIVRVDKDNEGNSASSYKDGTPRLWRVTGRTFRKQGVPLIDLELQEIRQYFKVVFMNGDEVYATQLVDHGEKATEPTAPTVGTGYAFEGWFTADNQEFNFNTSINQDITLYAKIEPQQISVTYEISSNTTISIERLSSDKENATIGSISTSETIYYNDQIKYVVSSSANFDYLGINVNDADTTSVNSSLTKIVTITEPTEIKTFIENWILVSQQQSVDVGFPNDAGSATTAVVVNNYNSGEELRVNTMLYVYLKNKITNDIDTLEVKIGQSGSNWLYSPGYVPFVWAVPSGAYESYYPFSIDFEFSPQSADSDITITVTKENADDYVSTSGYGMSFYALRKS